MNKTIKINGTTYAVLNEQPREGEPVYNQRKCEYREHCGKIAVTAQGAFIRFADGTRWHLAECFRMKAVQPDSVPHPAILPDGPKQVKGVEPKREHYPICKYCNQRKKWKPGRYICMLKGSKINAMEMGCPDWKSI